MVIRGCDDDVPNLDFGAVDCKLRTQPTASVKTRGKINRVRPYMEGDQYRRRKVGTQLRDKLRQSLHAPG